MPARRYMVSGLVQGVGYRFFTCEAAGRCGVKGFVRNLADGRVEAHAEGDEGSLSVFRSELERGPSFSQVRDVTEKDVAPSGVYPSFSIRG